MDQRQKDFINEYFQKKCDSNSSDEWSARDWFLHGIEVGSNVQWLASIANEPDKPRTASTQDEFKEKYGEYGEHYPFSI